MGSENSNQAHHNFPGFQMQKYLGQGMNQQQVLQIRQAFENFGPVDGYIDVTNYKARLSESGSRELIDKELSGKNKINFDEFFAISQKIVQEQLRKNPMMVLDSSEIQATCLFCPYAEDKVSN